MTLKATEREVLISHNRAKANEAIEQVAWLIENQKWHIAMNRVYYGIYYMLSAVAIQEYFETTKHQQLIGWFNKTYIKTGILDRKYGQRTCRMTAPRPKRFSKGRYDADSKIECKRPDYDSAKDSTNLRVT